MTPVLKHGVLQAEVGEGTGGIDAGGRGQGGKQWEMESLDLCRYHICVWLVVWNILLNQVCYMLIWVNYYDLTIDDG